LSLALDAHFPVELDDLGLAELNEPRDVMLQRI
jgi:hypothetical protein